MKTSILLVITLAFSTFSFAESMQGKTAPSINTSCTTPNHIDAPVDDNNKKR